LSHQKQTTMSKYVMTISEYGKEILSYSDTNIGEFMKQTENLIIKHLRERGKQKPSDDVKNLNIHIYTES
jgi:hypothetical protein